jgi:hypothetical protein
MLRKLIHVTLAVLLMTGAVPAQVPQMGMHLRGSRKPSAHQRAKGIRQSHRSRLSVRNKKIPEQNRSDAWGDPLLQQRLKTNSNNSFRMLTA